MKLIDLLNDVFHRGVKIRRPHWSDHAYIYYDHNDSCIVDSNSNTEYVLDNADYSMTDWEVCTPKKTDEEIIKHFESKVCKLSDKDPKQRAALAAWKAAAKILKTRQF